MCTQADLSFHWANMFVGFVMLRFISIIRWTVSSCGQFDRQYGSEYCIKVSYCLSFWLAGSVWVCVGVYTCVCISVSVCGFLSVWLYASHNLYLSVHLCVCLGVCVCVYILVHLMVCLCRVCVSICLTSRYHTLSHTTWYEQGGVSPSGETMIG